LNTNVEVAVAFVGVVTFVVRTAVGDATAAAVEALDTEATGFTAVWP
jgi:hypothetical protein